MFCLSLKRIILWNHSFIEVTLGKAKIISFLSPPRSLDKRVIRINQTILQFCVASIINLFKPWIAASLNCCYSTMSSEKCMIE